jgi:bifunctional UDP-N-acetylglucosamine pyrophosphorylase/glucosamine-1-phosphate N-acetyltransferase
MTLNDLAAVVLAAGQGKRMKSELPKVLHRAAGRSLLGYVLDSLAPLDVAHTVVVASNRVDDIARVAAAEEVGDRCDFVVQDPPRGTGDAARIALEALEGHSGPVLIVPGDTPLLSSQTMAALVSEHRSTAAAATLLTASAADPTGYGRVVRDEDGHVQRVVEHVEADQLEKLIHEINTSVYVFDAARLRSALERVDDRNTQGEFYLTDVVELMFADEEVVATYRTDEAEVAGVNSRVQLADVSKVMRERICEHWMLEGVTIVDPSSTFIDSTVTIGRDAVVHPFTFLEGSTSVGVGAEVGPQTRVVSSEIQDGARVSFAVIHGSSIGENAWVGPFASLRPGVRLERGAKLGTFVEAKNSSIGPNSKVNHLSYLGDAQIGSGVNVGAGSITCNWDGASKHVTVIEDDVYISSDTMFVAPVRIGRRAATGAGAVVRDDVPNDSLAVGIPARVIKGKGNRMGRKDDGEGR